MAALHASRRSCPSWHQKSCLCTCFQMGCTTLEAFFTLARLQTILNTVYFFRVWHPASKGFFFGQVGSSRPVTPIPFRLALSPFTSERCQSERSPHHLAPPSPAHFPPIPSPPFPRPARGPVDGLGGVAAGRVRRCGCGTWKGTWQGTTHGHLPAPLLPFLSCAACFPSSPSRCAPAPPNPVTPPFRPPPLHRRYPRTP